MGSWINVISERHDRVRDALAQTLKMCFPEAMVSTEEEVPGLVPAIGGAADGQERCRVRSDVYMEKGGSVTIFDVSIVNPGACSYTDPKSAEYTDVAAKDRERKKWQAFHERVPPDRQITFIPFVVEATG